MEKGKILNKYEGWYLRQLFIERAKVQGNADSAMYRGDILRLEQYQSQLKLIQSAINKNRVSENA